MATTPLSLEVKRDTYLAYLEHGSQRKAAKAMDVSHGTFQSRLDRISDEEKLAFEQGELGGELDPTGIPEVSGSRFILTSAQNATAVFTPFWDNLLVLAKHYDAQIMVSRFRYNVSVQQARQSKTDAVASAAEWYADELRQYIHDDRVRLCDGLVWAGDMNILPTAADPLSGMDSFTGLDSCVFPHAKIAMKSIAVAMTDAPKKNYTTGCVTLSNYIKRKAGQKAEFHHAYGALLVEIDDDGDYFCRQLNADDEGVICDLGIKVVDGKVKTNRPAALGAGDIHARNVDPVVYRATWGKGGLVDTLNPKNQFVGDVLDFDSRSHHNDIFDNYRLHCSGGDCVESEVQETFDCISGILRDDIKTHIKKGNHDEHMDRWLREGNFKTDLTNAPFYLEAMAAKLRAIKAKNDDFDLLEWSFDRIGGLDVEFISRNKTIVVAGIDMSQHGDMGPNGSRGSVRNLAKVGRKVNIEHSHSAHIFDGAYQAGTSTRLDMDYLKGPSSWSHVHILTHENGKRQMIEFKNGKWRG